MNPAPAQNEALKYLRACWRRKWMILGTTLFVGITVTLVSITLPDTFQSRTMILVTPQKVPENIVASTVTTDLQDRLSTITQQILSRTALETVIQEFSLFVKEKKEGAAPEEIFALMRKNIWISVDRGARRNEAFEVGYRDLDPRIAQAVTNRLAGLFIEENLKVREQQAAGTSQFLADEIERYKNEVRDKEQAIYDFKRRYLNEMTEQQPSNQAYLTQLQNQLQINTQTMNAAKDRKVLLQQQLAEIEKRVQEERDKLAAEAQSRRQRIAEDGGVDAGTALSSGLRPPSAMESELAARRAELSRLRLTLTDRHPDVVQLSTRVRQLERDVAQEGAKEGGGRPSRGAGQENAQGRGSPVANRDLRGEYPPIYEQLKLDSQRAEIEVARMAKENEQIHRSIEIYQGRISAAPGRELQMKQLSEGYNNVKAALNNLTDKKLQADLSENMERKQKGEQFRILDPANLPVQPVSPNRVKLVAAGFAGGGALGIGLVLLLDFVLPGVRTREELEAAVAYPVLGVIPEIVTSEDLAKIKKLRIWGAGAAAAVLVVAAVGVHFAVRPLPQAFSAFYHRVQSTHWTATKVTGSR